MSTMYSLQASTYWIKQVAIALGAVSIGLLSDMAHAAPANTPPQTVQQVDLNRYLGKWYEIAHLPMFFQRKCNSDTTATYTLKDNGHIEVLNQCKTATGKTNSARGDAVAIDSSNSKLKVSFLPKGWRWIPFSKGNYWILKIDDNYQTVLVGGPSRKYLWILSRTPTIDEQTYQDYMKTAQQQNFDTAKLIRTPQHQ